MKRDLLQLLAQKELKLELESEREKKKEFPGDKESITHHVAQINGKPLRYKATAGYLKIKDEKQKIKTRVFYISYEKEGLKDRTKRAVTFAFNGGPGAASAWVHFGAMGPKRVKFTEEGKVCPPPYEFVNNEYSWLEFTDLVFVDPIGTGYSSPGEDEDSGQFYGVEEDIKWVGEFIRIYISRNNRWLSPKFIAGESYGTYRAAGLIATLQEKYAMDFNGVVFISSALDYLYFDFSPGNDLPYLLFLPAYTATAWYHKKLPEELRADLKKTLEVVEDWALSEYSQALIKGDLLSDEERDRIIGQMSQYTGLSKEYIDDSNLRVKPHRFMKQILKDTKEVVGLYDSRLKAPDIDPMSDKLKTDPSLFNIYGSCIGCLHDFLRNELKYENDLPYKPLSRDVSKNWDWASGIDGGMGYVSVTEKLVEAMNYNRYLNVFFACGYFDLCTSYFLHKYTIAHMGLDPRLKENVTYDCYEAGHMMYVHMPSRKKLFNDLSEFYKKRNSYEPGEL
ncbi:MAG: peptidase S10 [Candidatus Eremiobacteraeota bacterium]|nr:peptidase S10 [Candidatus Eremiobacteraeota bacterium]